MVQINELTVNSKNLFRRWLLALDQQSQIEVDVRLERVQNGNLGNWRSLGSGVYELKFQSGLRIYYAWEQRNKMLILLGGSKVKQSVDIGKARALWDLYSKNLSNI